MDRCQYDKTDLANFALSQLGSDRLHLADFSTDTGTIKETVDLFFNSVLEELTAMAAWNCCLKSAALTSAETVPVFGYDFAHELPADCVRVYQTSAAQGVGYKNKPNDYEISTVGGMRVINTNHDNPYIVYTALPEDTDNTKHYDMMDSLFARAFYTLLAARMCVSITGNSDLESALLDEFYNIVLPDAFRADAIEGKQVQQVGEDYKEICVNSYTTFDKV
jgi:hypothetical protein